MRGLKFEHGATMIEFALAMGIVAMAIVFVLDFGVALFRWSALNHVTADLARTLSTDLGHAWSTNAVSVAPYNGNCNAFLRAQGEAYLAGKYDQTYSMTNPGVRFYLGSTIDNSTALISDPRSPYAILRVVGDLGAPCVLCNFFPSALITSESSILVEFHSANCSDY